MTTPLTNKAQLIDYFMKGCKPPSGWRIGTEHEKFLLINEDFKRFPYEGTVSIRRVFEELHDLGWEPIFEGSNPIALKKSNQRASITLEPGGQFEYSGAPLATLHETKEELEAHLHLISDIIHKIGGRILPMGADPLWAQKNMSWVPKSRYKLMRKYMPTKGTMGLDMMTRTCTVQVNLDYQSETDMVSKMRLGMALQPVATALFACSPFLEGKLTGYQSYRAHIWQNTDPDRCGILPFVFDEGMGFEAYADYLLSIPMYFVYRKGKYIDALGQSFQDFMNGRLPALPGEYPILKDWADQTTIAFPETRLKRFLEMRGADCGPQEMMLALPSFWVGLLYDSIAQDEALQLIRNWSVQEILKLYSETPQKGLKASIGKQSLQIIAQDVLNISAKGLQRRAKLHGSHDESLYLTPLFQIADSGRTLATKMIELYEETGSVEPVIRRYIHLSGVFAPTAFD